MLDASLCAILAIPLLMQNRYWLALSTGICSVMGDALECGPYWKWADRINASIVSIIEIYEIHYGCHPLTWIVAIFSYMVFAVSCYARALGVHFERDAQALQRLWHVCASMTMMLVSVQ